MLAESAVLFVEMKMRIGYKQKIFVTKKNEHSQRCSLTQPTTLLQLNKEHRLDLCLDLCLRIGTKTFL